MLFTLMTLALPVCAVLAAATVNGKMPRQNDFRKSPLAEMFEPLRNPLTLKIVTFNVHGLYLASRDRPQRMTAIAKKLATLDPDVVGLQETFVESDRSLLIEGLKDSRLKYYRYFPSATVGSGLFILSAFPIVEEYYHRYAQNGKWYKLYHGDWWAGKGVALARLALPDQAGYVDFYNTHAHAAYGGSEYDADRLAQMVDLSGFVKASGLGASPAFVVGDMNCRPGDGAFEAAVGGGCLQRLMDVSTDIDHIFSVSNALYTFEVVKTEPIADAVTGSWGRRVALSDHTGYMSTIRITPTQGQQ